MLENLSTKYAQLNPRVYEILSVVLVSAGINTVTNSLGPNGLAGYLFVFGGIGLFFIAATVSSYFEIGRGMRDVYVKKVFEEVKNRTRPPSEIYVPSVAQLAEDTAISRPNGRKYLDQAVLLASFILLLAASYLLIRPLAFRSSQTGQGHETVAQHVEHDAQEFMRIVNNTEAAAREIKEQQNELSLLRSEVASLHKDILRLGQPAEVTSLNTQNQKGRRKLIGR